MKVAIIGLGHQELKDHFPAIKVSKDVELVGIVENDKQKIEFFLKENKEVVTYNNFEDLIKKKENQFLNYLFTTLFSL